MRDHRIAVKLEDAAKMCDKTTFSVGDVKIHHVKEFKFPRIAMYHNHMDITYGELKLADRVW